MMQGLSAQDLLPEIAVLAFLLLQSISDLRKKQILIWPSLLLAAAGLSRLLFLQPSEARSAAFLAAALALLPGLFLLLMSRMTRGGIGSGDGLCLLCLSAYLKLADLCLLLLGSVSLSAVYAGFLLFKKKGRNYAYPFLPFFFLASCVRFFLVLFA